MSDTRRITDIIVKDRIRGDMGNVAILEGSIKAIGLLQPVVINTRNELVAGERRFTACKNLGWEDIPVRVVATLDNACLALQAEREENTARLALSPTDLERYAARLRELEEPEARKRQTAGINQHTEPSGNLPPGSTGKTRDKVAAALGIGGRTLEKIEKAAAVIRADPEKHADLAAKMSQPGAKVDPIYKEVKRREGAAKPPKPEPEGERHDSGSVEGTGQQPGHHPGRTDPVRDAADARAGGGDAPRPVAGPPAGGGPAAAGDADDRHEPGGEAGVSVAYLRACDQARALLASTVEAVKAAQRLASAEESFRFSEIIDTLKGVAI